MKQSTYPDFDLQITHLFSLFHLSLTFLTAYQPISSFLLLSFIYIVGGHFAFFFLGSNSFSLSPPTSQLSQL